MDELNLDIADLAGLKRISNAKDIGELRRHVIDELTRAKAGNFYPHSVLAIESLPLNMDAETYARKVVECSELAGVGLHTDLLAYVKRDEDGYWIVDHPPVCDWDTITGSLFLGFPNGGEDNTREDFAAKIDWANATYQDPRSPQRAVLEEDDEKLPEMTEEVRCGTQYQNKLASRFDIFG
jgi:hypothetical protein